MFNSDKLYENKDSLKKLNILAEILIIFGIYWITTYIRFVSPIGIAFSIFDSVKFMVLAFVFTFVIVFVTYVSGGYFTFHSDSFWMEFRRVFFSTVIGVSVNCTIIYFLKWTQFSRVFMAYFAILTFIVIFVKRRALSRLVKYYDKKHEFKSDVVMIGSGEDALRAYNAIFTKHYRNLYLKAYVADEENPKIPGYAGDYSKLREIIEDSNATMIVMADPDLTRNQIKEVVVLATNHNIRVCIIPRFADFMPSKNAAVSIEGISMCDLTAIETCDIMGVNISVTDMDKTVKKIKDNLAEWSGKYICVSNVHTTVTASEDEKYKDIQNKAVIALPDGGPLSKFSRDNGYVSAKRVTGPDLMQRILMESAEHGWKHYFYGSTQETLDKLRKVIDERYPGVEICGMMSPPFRTLTAAEDAEIVKELNAAEPDFIWVGLGAPKQEIWMAAHEGRVKGLMIGVGAAFDYESGNIKRAPQWMQNHNLEWLFRLLQDPKRLFTRYIVTNTKYMVWKYQHGGRN